jgi:hypothetical protein
MFVEQAVFSSAYVLGAFVKNQVDLPEWIHVWVFYSVLLWSSSMFLCQYHAIFIAMAL